MRPYRVRRWRHALAWREGWQYDDRHPLMGMQPVVRVPLHETLRV